MPATTFAPGSRFVVARLPDLEFLERPVRERIMRECIGKRGVYLDSTAEGVALVRFDGEAWMTTFFLDCLEPEETWLA